MTAPDFFLTFEPLFPADVYRCLASYADLTRPIQRVPTIIRMKRLMTELGNPQEKLRVIHIAGTSGKGSVTTLTARLLEAHGFTVGMTISPHVRDVRERIQINSESIPLVDLARLLGSVLPVLRAWSEREEELPHYFELMTALAFLYFAEQQVDYAVIETGMGGRYDATNVVQASNKICVFTPIDLDHQRFLGSTRAKIAEEKVGILTSGCHAWSAPQRPEVQEVFAREAYRCDAILKYTQEIKDDVEVTSKGTIFSDPTAVRSWSRVELGLHGKHQAENTILALDVVTELGLRDGWELSEVTSRQALKQISLPGRFTIYSYKDQPVVLDGAHNPQKIESLLITAKQIYPNQAIHFLLGIASLDHATEIAELMKRYRVQVSLADFEIGDGYTRYRLANATELTSIFVQKGVAVRSVVSSVEQFLEGESREKSKNIGIISGSFYLVSHALPILDQIC